MSKASLIGIGSYLPLKVLSNSDLEGMIETTDEWIMTRTGIKERRIAGADEYPSTMGALAARKALENADLDPLAVEMILVCTMSPDYISPSTAALIQHLLGAANAAAMDIQAACSGFIYGLSIAKAYVESGLYKNILLIASEKMSAFLDYQDRNSCVLFGDGASACVISSEKRGLSIDSVCLGADGDLAHLVIIPGGGARHPCSQETLAQKLHYFKMSGKEVFKYAVKQMEIAAQHCLTRQKLMLEEISWVIPHQANARIMDALAKKFNMPESRLYRTIHKYGNTSASCIPIALDELLIDKDLKPQDHLLLLAAGGGMTWGAAILTKI
jgi:3-oxoacyl-[acyl-carrier-protein] synthase III